MKDLEQELQRALRRREPPEGFADRVMARVPREIGARPGKRSLSKWWMSAAATACLAVIGASSYEIHRRDVEGRRAQQELIYALSIASGKLDAAKHILSR